jgi:hypothetical protein
MKDVAMKKIVYALVGLIAIAGSPWAGPKEASAGSARLVARMTMANGGTQTITLEGVGCSEALCSRVAVRSRPEGDSRVTKTWLDTVAAIKDISADGALFVLKNGTSRRLSVVHDNRFIYFADQRGAEKKIDLAGIQSIEFSAPGR